MNFSKKNINLSLSSNSLIPSLNLAEFTKNFSKALLPLINLLHSNTIREHPTWGKNIPYNQSNYGEPNTRSCGHMLRIDGMLGADNKFRFSEMDFVPGGLGVISATLDEYSRDEFLACVIKWLKSLDAERYLLATGTKTTLWGENGYLAELMSQKGVPFERINIDKQHSLRSSDLVLRQFYRSECISEQPKGRYITQEPWLDSKAIFALVHDQNMTSELRASLGQENLNFLRDVMPETYIYSNLKTVQSRWLSEFVENENLSDWLIKASEVETDFCWASRSVFIAKMYNNLSYPDLKQAFLNGKSPDRDKNTGHNPILQRFHLSTDFRELWNTFVSRSKPSTFLRLLNEDLDSHIVDVPATGYVSGRFAIHFFVSMQSQEVYYPNYGYITLRQSHLAHGDRDSIEGAFKII